MATIAVYFLVPQRQRRMRNLVLLGASLFFYFFGEPLGILLMLTGVMIATGWTIATGKMILVICILWMTSPVSSHLIGRMEITINDELEKDMTVIDRRSVQKEKEGD